MRMEKTFSNGKSWGLALAGLLGLLLVSPSGLAASAYPYPQNVTYAHGVKPPSPASGSWANDFTNIQTKWTTWKAAHVTATGAGGGSNLRVQRDSANGFDTVSEGISYGMLMAVYFDDQATYNGLWQYKQLHNDGLGLMNWDINSGGGTVGGNSATDADEDIAYSLYLASYQWGNGGTYNYKALGDAEVLKLKEYDLDGNNQLKPGDSFNSCEYPSYFFPNEYTVFGNQTSDSYTWNQVAANCYSAISASRNSGTGLLAEECQVGGGQGGGCGVSSTQYLYNSCRVPFRMTLDYVYYNTAGSSGELSLLRTFFGSIAPTNVDDGYNLNGSASSSNNLAAFEGPAACSFMSGGASLQSYYNQLLAYNDSSYFSGALQILSLLLLSGNMPNIADPGAIYTPTMTPSPTPYAGTPTFTATQTPIAFGYIFEDFEVGSLAGAYPYKGTGTSAISYVDSTNSPDDGTYSLMLDVTVPAGQYAGMGFSSNYANANGVVDATGSNALRFAIKTNTTVTFTMQIREAGSTITAVAGGDGELWDSAPITVFAGPGWVNEMLPLSFSAAAWHLDPYDPVTGKGDNVLNLSAVKVIQLNFSSVVTGATVSFDDIAFVPSVAPTPTFTKTPFNNPYSQIYDDFESPMSLSQPARAGTYADTANGASATWALSNSTVADGLASGKLTYNTGNASAYGCGGFDISPYGTPSLYVDASGAVTLGYWINAPAGLKYKMEFQEAGTPTSPTVGADGEAWLSPLLTAGAGWQWVQVDIATFTEDPYNTVCNPTGITAPGPCLSGPEAGNDIQNMQAISSVSIKLDGNQGSGSLYLDDLTFITTFKTATPTRSPSPSVTPTRSPSPSASPSPTDTASPTSTPSPSPTNTITVASSSTFTSTPSPSPSGTNTPSPSPTDSASASPSATSSQTLFQSPTASPSSTPYAGSPTDSATITPTSSSTPSRTASPSFSATGTPSPSVTDTSSVTNGPSPTGSSTPTTGSSATSSSTVTIGASATSTVTPSASPSATSTATPSASASPSATSSNTPLPGSSSTSTATPTNTPAYDAWDPTDNTSAGATTLSFPVGSPAVSATHDIGYGSDGADWFKATLVAGHQYTLAITVEAGISVALYSPSMTLLQTYNGGGSGTFVATVSGTYYLDVTSSLPLTYALTTDDDDIATPTPTFSATPSPSATQTSVAPMISDLGFTWSPKYLTVTVGTDVTWAWVGTHDVQSDTGVFSSGGVPVTGGHFNFMFTTVGTYPYHCTLHGGTGGAGMSGVIYVIPAVPVVPTATAAPTDDDQSDAGPIIKTLAFPNPNPKKLAVKLNKSVDGVTLKVYSEAFMVIDSVSSGPHSAGWAMLGLPPGFVASAKSGTYYYVVTVVKNGSSSRLSGTGRFVILR
jgi:endo-1,4-beta-D-glucanase Y/plastocyanin